MHWHSGKLLVKFLGVDTRNAAEELRGSIVQVERDELEIPQDPDEFYDSNLLGCAVVMLNGETIGSVTDVLHLPAQDVLVVTSGEREILIPFVEDMVPQINIAAQQIVVDPPPGLLTDE